MKRIFVVAVLAVASIPVQAQGCFGYCGQLYNPMWNPPAQYPVPITNPQLPLTGQGSAADVFVGNQYRALPAPQQQMIIRQLIQSGAPAWQVQWLIQNGSKP